MEYPANSCGRHQWGSNRDGDEKCNLGKGKSYDPMDPELMAIGDSNELCCPHNHHDHDDHHDHHETERDCTQVCGPCNHDDCAKGPEGCHPCE